MATPASSPIRSAFAIGGPVFNGLIVAVLGTISFLAVAMPEPTDAFATAGVVDADEPVPVAAVPRFVSPTTTTTTTTTTMATTIEPSRGVLVGDGSSMVEVAPPPPPAPTEIVRVVYRTEPDRSTSRIVTCADFAEQPAAQVVFDSDPGAHDHFDGDGDGRACEHLPGTPPEVVAVVEPPQVLSVAAVRSQQGVFGMHTREAPWWMGELDYVTRLIGKNPNNLLFFSNWAKPFPADEVATAWSRGMTPQVAWEAVVPGADSQPKLQEILDGEWDPYIDAWAAAAAAHGQPIVLRFASEMNGHWYPWSENAFGNQAGQFAPVWRHVHGRFQAAGADNVVWLWSVNRVDNLSTDIATYWPGEEYVDWVGISGYWRGFETAPEPTFEAVFARTLGELRAITDMPILLAEIGAGTDVDSDRVAWLNTVFTGLAANPDVIGFVYFNDKKAGGDWRVQFSQGMVDAFAAGVADDRWASGVLPPGMEPGERLMVPAFGDPDVDQGAGGPPPSETAVAAGLPT